MNVAFRTDATKKIGTGHFMRCLTLADALAQRGVQILFICRDLPLHLQNMLEKKGMELALIGYHADPTPIDDLPHSHWLGTSQASDAEATLQTLSDHIWDWLIVDHYALDARWEKAMRLSSIRKIMVIDDLADRIHDCDILLDQNFYSDMRSRYTGIVPDHCQLFLGPRYALLREEFLKLREQIKPRKGPVKRILVFFGGVDADNYTGQAIDALATMEEKDLQVDVVIGTLHPYLTEIELKCAKYGFICHVQTDRMAELMAEADLSIGAGGSASWERCCLGLPTLIISIADNQIDIAEALDLNNCGVYFGQTKMVNTKKIKQKFMAFLRDREKLEILSRRSLSLVDGKGINRIYRKLNG
jgi:UDP-2,4-diacetamido-2,4,6-trideoxy-beta-L-altropyranose hydrolase